MPHTVTVNLTVSARSIALVVLLFALLLAGSASAATGSAPPAAGTKPPAADALRERPPATPNLVTRYWSAPGASFHAYDNGATYTAAGDVCVHATSGDLWVVRGLELPDGAHISRVEMAGYDNDPTFDMTLWFRVATLNGTLVGGGTAQSSGGGGNGIWGVDVNVTVDNYNYAYGLVWTNNAVTSLMLCAVDVTYQVPITSALLPVHLYNPVKR